MFTAERPVRDGVIEIGAIRRNPRRGGDARRQAEPGGDVPVGPELASERDDGRAR